MSKKLKIISLVVASCVSATLNAGFYDGVYGAVNETNEVKYIKLKNVSVVLDSKKYSTISLLRLKGIAQEMKIPNVRFVNNRFLVFGDYNRVADAEFIWKRLKKVLGEKYPLKIAQSDIFGDSVVLTPLIVRAFQERTKKKSNKVTFMSDHGVNGNVPISSFDESTGIQNNLVEQNFEYDNSSWDEAQVSSKDDFRNNHSLKDGLNELKQANVENGYIVIDGQKIYSGNKFKGYRIVEVNVADRSFLIQGKGSFWMIDNNNLIKM